MNKFNKIATHAKNLFIQNQPFVLFSIIALGVPVLISYVPYLNLVYTLDKGVALYLLMVIVITRPSAKSLLLFGIILLFLSLNFLWFGFAVLAEQVGNIIFLLLMIGIFSIISGHFRDAL